MPTTRPIFLFAFANDAQASLRLGDEQNACWNELEELHRQEKIEYQNMGFATLEQVYQRFNKYNGQVYLFHFGGHSNSEVIQLHGAAGSAATIRLSSRRSLGAKIGQQQNLKLVFLNGCKNYGQGMGCPDRTVPVDPPQHPRPAHPGLPFPKPPSRFEIVRRGDSPVTTIRRYL